MRCVARILAALNRKYGRQLDEPELEDLAQDTTIAVWRKLDRYDGRAALETWVYRFCFLELMKRLRQRRSGLALIEDLPERADHEPLAPPVSHASDHEEVYRGLARLDPDEAAIVRLRFFEELTFEEAGARLGIPDNTAKSRFYRGIRKLKELLGETTMNRMERGKS